MRGAIHLLGRSCVALLALLGLVLASVPAGAAAQYTITDLGTLGGLNGEALSINESGQVVGAAETADGIRHAFLWLPSPAYGMSAGMHDLGTLGGLMSDAYGINNSGQVVGKSNYDSGWESQAYLYGDGAMDELGTFDGVSSSALAINSLGHVVGNGKITRTTWHACLWKDGVMYDLGVPVGDYNATTAQGINDSGQIVGKADIASGHSARAFLWEAGVFQILPDFNGTVTTANDINSSGQIVGFAYAPGVTGVPLAVLWENGMIHDLGTLGGNTAQAMAINDRGEVVGESRIEGSGTYDDHAFLWQSGIMYDLNDLIPAGSGWVLREARDINDRGQIVGTGRIGGESHGFLLTLVPEPSAAGLVGVAVLAALRRLRRGRGRS